MKTKFYQSRPIRFLEIYACAGWRVKIYSISLKAETVTAQAIIEAKKQLPAWLENSKITALENYQIATLILHEGNEGCFAVLIWWADENMLQLFAYLRLYGESHFHLISNKGTVSCVWEMAFLWFERNAWITHVLKRGENPDFENYLQQQLQTDI
ncbi:MAG TPA: hypothetical protein PLI38_10970 [Flavobacterium sp.]|jgi:hypothetical protein|nr:hypothetical protein [Flavobacterium sp.]